MFEKIQKSLEVYNPGYSKDDLEKAIYGIQGLYKTVPKLLIILILSFVLNIAKETIMLIFFFNILRHFAFGIHLPKSYICFTISALIFIGLSLISNLIVINLWLKAIICIFYLFSVILYAPADTKKRPLLDYKKRKRLKLISFILGSIYIIGAFFIKNNLIRNSIIFSMLIEGMLILPFSYYILKEPYQNYKYYKRR